MYLNLRKPFRNGGGVGSVVEDAAVQGPFELIRDEVSWSALYFKVCRSRQRLRSLLREFHRGTNEFGPTSAVQVTER